MDVLQVAERARQIVENVGRVIVGKEAAIELIVVALLCEAHVLIEDVPGLGKTVLARALARSLGGGFQRIQFTPDLLPSDVTGLTFFNQQSQAFQFRAGPVFTNVLLADEINRATPRTQSALLEAMAERQVTIDGQTRPLPRPFLVLATQNPIELEGTFPLPEAQLDRFTLRLSLGYPSRDEELRIAHRFEDADPLASLDAVVDLDEVLELGRACRQVHVSEPVGEYIVDVVRATRDRIGVELGASPRATLALWRCGQALAAIRGRAYVLPDDVKHLAPAVLAHRLALQAADRLHGGSPATAVEQILSAVPVPVEDESLVVAGAAGR